MINPKAMKLLSILFVISCVFPYTQIIPNESYSQPYALLIGSLIFVLNGPKVFAVLPRSDAMALLGLAFVGIAALLISCWPAPNPQELKYLLIYVSPLVLTVASLAVLRTHYEACVKTLVCSVIVWLVVGCIQTLYDPTFLTFLVGTWQDAATVVVDSGRGVLGLAPEPTHYGFHLLVMGAVLVMLRRNVALAWLCVLGALLLARSSSALLALGLAGILAVLQQPVRFRWVILSGLLAIPIGLVVINQIDSAETRVLRLLIAFFSEPSTFLLVDYSVNARLGGLIASFRYCFETFLMPNGLSSDHWLEISEELVRRFVWLLDVSTSGPPSGFGIILYQVGFFGIPFLVRPVSRILGFEAAGVSRVIVISCFFVFMSQYMISAPGYSLLYAALIHRAVLRRDGAMYMAARERGLAHGGMPSHMPAA